MSIFANYQPPSAADLQAAIDHILAMPRTADGDPRDGERVEDVGRGADDGVLADRAAGREFAARWPA